MGSAIISLRKNNKTYLLGFILNNVNDKREANINSSVEEFKMIKSNGFDYFTGKIRILEWVDGKAKDLSILPEMYLVSEDETSKIPVYISYEGGSVFYFDFRLTNVDMTKKYRLFLKLEGAEYYTDSKNISMYAKFENTIASKFETDTIKSTRNGNTLSFEKIKYDRENISEVTSLDLRNINGSDYIIGKVNIFEKEVNTKLIPEKPVEMYLKDNSGNKIPMYINKENNGEYYFDKNISGLNISEYKLYTNILDAKNISNKKEALVNLEKFKEELMYKDNTEKSIYLKGNGILEILPKVYRENLKTKLIRFEQFLENNSKYISGNIDIYQIINDREVKLNSNQQENINRFKVVLLDDLNNETNMYSNKDNDGSIYFDLNLLGLKRERKYRIVVKDIKNNNNIVKEHEVISDKLAKNYSFEKFGMDSNIVLTEEKNNGSKTFLVYYEGEKRINLNLRNNITLLKGFNVLREGNIVKYIAGNIDVYDLNNNNEEIDHKKVNIKLIDENNKEYSTYNSYENGNKYYFDINIDGLDFEKTYKISVKYNGNEVENSEFNNIQNESNRFEIEKIRKDEINIKNKGEVININSNIINVKSELLSGNRKYLIGNIYANITSTFGNVENRELEIYLKDEEGNRYDTYHSYEGNNKYYFDKNISGIDKNKKYGIYVKYRNKEVELNNYEIKNNSLEYEVKMLPNTNRSKFEIKERENKIDINANMIELKSELLSENRRYLIGNIYANITSTLGNVENRELEIYLKDEEGNRYDTYHSYEGNNRYYFDRNISGIDKNKKYGIYVKYRNKEVELKGYEVNNNSLEYEVKMLSNTNNSKFEIKERENKIDVNTNIIEFKTETFSSDRKYIIGNINVDILSLLGKPDNTKVEIYLKDEEGNRYDTYHSYEGNNKYYFDKNISGMDTSLKYKLIIKYLNIEKEISFNNLYIKNNSNNFKIEKRDENKLSIINSNNEYNIAEGLLNLKTININPNTRYLIGNINIEILNNINNDRNINQNELKLYLEDGDNNKIDTYHSYEGNNKYYFDRNITGFSGKYSLVVEYRGAFKKINLNNINVMNNANDFYITKINYDFEIINR